MEIVNIGAHRLHLSFDALKPPALTLRVMMPAGNRELCIGGEAQGSHLRYARVGDGAHSDVFMLSENDSAILARAWQTLRQAK